MCTPSPKPRRALAIPQAVVGGYDWDGRACCIVSALWPEQWSRSSPENHAVWARFKLSKLPRRWDYHPSRQEGGYPMPRVALPDGASVNCVVDDYLWPWERSTPVLMMHGFARNAMFWTRWVPAVAGSHRVYRPDLLGCGLSDQPPANYRYTLEATRAQILAVLDGLSLSRVHWVGESSGGIIGLLLAAAAPDRIESLVLCNTPTRIPDAIRRTYALGQASASDAMLAQGV